MILLDTNVISEPMRSQPDARVIAWLDAQIAETLYLSAVTVFELVLGVAVLPQGRRRHSLNGLVENVVADLFDGRVVSLDEPVARLHAEFAAMARDRGVALSESDGWIAASAKSNGFAVATRDVSPFEAVGLDVVNPWSD